MRRRKKTTASERIRRLLQKHTHPYIHAAGPFTRVRVPTTHLFSTAVSLALEISSAPEYKYKK